MKTAQRGELAQACLLGGAMGDALGAPVASLSWQQIGEQFGESGLQAMMPAPGGVERVTHHTQTMLFTAEGMLRSYVRIQERNIYDPVAAIHHALIRWLVTQDVAPNLPRVDRRIGLVGDPRLHARRSPDETSLNTLQQAPALSWQPHNDANGCEAVTRSVPIGLFPWGDFLLRHNERAFSVACESARLTHGHPCAYLCAGTLAYLVNGMLENAQPLETLIPKALNFVDSGACIGFYIYDEQERNVLPRCQAQIRFLLEAALDFHAQGAMPTPQAIDSLITGRTAQESLAIAVWCALAARDYRQGALWAVNHGGDSSGTGLIAGSLLGLRFGLKGLPQDWLEAIELRDCMERLGHDLQWLPQVYIGRGHGQHDAELRKRYPEW